MQVRWILALLALSLGLAASGQAKPACANATLRLLTFNDRTAHADADADDAPSGNDWAQRRPLVLALLKELDPDVVGVQEATDGQVQELAPGFTVLRQEEVALLYRGDRLEALEGGALKLGEFGFQDSVQDHRGTFHAFKGEGSGGRIDFIAGRGLKALGSGVHTGSEHIGERTVYPSDHYPVWAAFQWPR